MNNTTEWLKEIELQLNYVCYEKEMITKLQKVWEALINAQSKVEKLPIHGIINWVSVSDELPKEYEFRMSRDVLTIAGSKMSVKSYDYELGRWNGSQHITVTHWLELPSSPCR